MRKRNIILLIFSVLLFQACSYVGSDSLESSGEGTGGSMARFTIIGDYLFTVDNTNLKTFDISSIEEPEYIRDKYVGDGVETIFPLGNKLFLGTSNGMHIYDISNEGEPTHISFYEHVISCDPVVSDGEYAYVTLSSGREWCWRAVNELHIIDLANIQNPQLVKQYPMENPRGLAINSDTLWVCDNGLKVLDVSDKNNIKQLYSFTNLQAYDIILDRDRALVIGESGFVQYKLENDTIRRLSEINIK